MSEELAPNVSGSGGVASWIQTWITAVTKPNEQTFADLAERPGAEARKAYLWIFVTAWIGVLVSGIIQLVVLGSRFGQLAPEFTRTLGTSVASLLCVSPFAAGFSVLGFMIGVGLIQWVAKMFGGAGTYDKLAYAFGAVAAPAALVSAVITLLSAIPYVGILGGLLGFAMGIYVLVLEVMAVKGVNRFGWGKAIGSVLLPALALGLLVACLVIGILMLLGPMIGDVYNQILSGLGGY